MRGFSGAGRSGIGGRTRRFDRSRAAKAAAGLALYLLAGALACAQDVSQPLDAPARLTFDMASVQANVAGLAILTLMLLATITAVLHLIGRRVWTRRVRELETELARTNAKLDRAALMLRGHCITNPCASMSCRTVASGLLLDTKITVPSCLSVCIDPLALPDSTLSPWAFDWP